MNSMEDEAIPKTSNQQNFPVTSRHNQLGTKASLPLRNHTSKMKFRPGCYMIYESGKASVPNWMPRNHPEFFLQIILPQAKGLTTD